MPLIPGGVSQNVFQQGPPPAVLYGNGTQNVPDDIASGEFGVRTGRLGYNAVMPMLQGGIEQQAPAPPPVVNITQGGPNVRLPGMTPPNFPGMAPLAPMSFGGPMSFPGAPAPMSFSPLSHAPSPVGMPQYPGDTRIPGAQPGGIPLPMLMGGGALPQPRLQAPLQGGVQENVGGPAVPGALPPGIMQKLFPAQSRVNPNVPVVAQAQPQYLPGMTEPMPTPSLHPQGGGASQPPELQQQQGQYGNPTPGYMSGDVGQNGQANAYPGSGEPQSDQTVGRNPLTNLPFKLEVARRIDNLDKKIDGYDTVTPDGQEYHVPGYDEQIEAQQNKLDNLLMGQGGANPVPVFRGEIQQLANPNPQPMRPLQKSWLTGKTINNAYNAATLKGYRQYVEDLDKAGQTVKGNIDWWYAAGERALERLTARRDHANAERMGYLGELKSAVEKEIENKIKMDQEGQLKPNLLADVIKKILGTEDKDGSNAQGTFIDAMKISDPAHEAIYESLRGMHDATQDLRFAALVDKDQYNKATLKDRIEKTHSDAALKRRRLDTFDQEFAAKMQRATDAHAVSAYHQFAMNFANDNLAENQRLTSEYKQAGINHSINSGVYLQVLAGLRASDKYFALMKDYHDPFKQANPAILNDIKTQLKGLYPEENEPWNAVPSRVQADINRAEAYGAKSNIIATANNKIASAQGINPRQASQMQAIFKTGSPKQAIDLAKSFGWSKDQYNGFVSSMGQE